MSKIIEYVDRRRDIPFEESNFNEVDSLVLSQLAYLNFNIINTYNIQVLSQITDGKMMEDMVKNTWNPSENLKLLNKVCHSLRFGSIQIVNRVNILSEEQQQQFSAVTFKLSKSLYYISFRGTDATIIGWKEDFNMSYQEIIPSQISATQYVEKMIELYPGKYILGGHSKGGNLATFAGAFSNLDVQNYILAMYNHDGPGFHKSIVESSEYQKVVNKIFKTVPESSIVGILLEESQNFKVIKSDAIGFFQHDPFTWIVEDAEFVTKYSTSSISRFAQNTILTWIKTADNSTKKVCLDSMYSIATSTGAIKLKDMKKISPRNLKIISLSILNTDMHVKKQWIFITNLFLKTSITESIHLVKKIPIED